MTKRKSDFTLPAIDDLFTTQEMRDDANSPHASKARGRNTHSFTVKNDKKDASLLRTALNIRCEPSESRRETGAVLGIPELE